MTAPQDDQITTLAGHLHAATAQFVDLATACDERAEWSGIGMQSCAHWLTISTGIDLWSAREMLRVGHALRALPLIREAFASGRLSFDKVRALSHVATTTDEVIWLEVAFQAAGSQLARICRQFRRSVAVDDAQRGALQRSRRRVVSWWLDEDGMLALYATLPPEEGRLVLNAIEAAVVRPAPSPVAAADRPAATVAAVTSTDPCAEDEPDDPHGALRADALVRICASWLGIAAAGAPSGAATPELVVHVDLDTLRGADDGGRCHLEDGPAISLATARRSGCDASVVGVIEHDGIPLDVGRSRRIVSGRMRRLLQIRDAGCRYPGCTVPVADTEGHHVVHWIDGGRTELKNLASLCRFHHHRHHAGAFRIIAMTADRRRQRPGSDFRFETMDGRRPIGSVRLQAIGTRPALPIQRVRVPKPAAAGSISTIRSRFSRPISAMRRGAPRSSARVRSPLHRCPGSRSGGDRVHAVLATGTLQPRLRSEAGEDLGGFRGQRVSVACAALA